MNRLAGVALWIGACFAAIGDSRADWQVWTVAQTRRVLRDEPAGSAVEARLAVARNQWRGFQILLRSDAPLAGVRVEAGDLQGPGGAILRAADARLYRQHQFHLTKATYRNDRFKAGWYPDALIPFDHPLTRKPLAAARLAAVPFDLPAGETHGFWVDLHAPPGASPGEYRGVYRVTAGGGKTAEVPVTLTVWDFSLPTVPTMRTALGSPANALRGYCQRRAKQGKEKEPADWAGVDAQCAELVSRHRINATPPALVPARQPDGTFRIPGPQVAALREFADRYHINAVQVLHPSEAVKDPVAERERLGAWLKSFDRAAAELNRPQVLFYTYLKDEPNTEAEYKYVQTWGRAVRQARSAVKVLVVEQPQPQDPAWGDLYGAVDIWCPLFSLFEPKPVADRLALGETVWTYTALCQGDKRTPWWHTDYPLLNYRVPAWIAWRYRVSGLLYWGDMAYWSQVDDPWVDPQTYWTDDKSLLFNGEGSLLYPGRAAGYDGVAPSLRLKALRDSIDDYEYLAMLARLGRASEAEQIVLPLAPSWFQWEPEPAAYEPARAKLAQLILAAKR
jgi:hypothetical protein